MLDRKAIKVSAEAHERLHELSAQTRFTITDLIDLFVFGSEQKTNVVEAKRQQAVRVLGLGQTKTTVGAVASE